MDLPAIISMVATNGIGAACAVLVIWLAWYRETRTIPKLMEGFAKAQKQALDTFSQLVREERDECQRQHTENRERIDALAERLRSFTEKKPG